MLRRIAVIVAVAVLALLPLSALASPTAVVTVVGVPGAMGGISNFVITYTSDTQLDLSWTLYGDAVNIMVRGKYGSYPADIPNDTTTPSDGYLVYYGSGSLVSDTSMNFDQNPGLLYYKAWAQKADGTWYIATGTGSKESRVVLFIGMIFLVFGLTIASFTLKGIIAPILRLASAILWIIMIPIMLSQNWTTTNTYLPTAISYFCIIMCIVMVIMTVIYVVDWRTSRRTHEPTDEEYQASYAHQVRKLTKKKGQWD